MRSVLKRRISVWTVAIMAVLLVIGTATVACARTTVDFWAWATDAEATALRAIVEKFNSSQQDVEVKLLLVPNLDQKFKVAFAGGMPPDVYALSWGATSSYAQMGAFLPLDSFMAMNEIYEEDFPAAIWDACHHGGLVYSIPYSVDCRILLYNKALFEEAGLDPETPPKDWNELVAFSDKITKKDEEGRITTIGFTPLYDQGFYWTFLLLAGGRMFDKDLTEALFGTEEGFEAFKFRLDLVNRYGRDAMLAYAQNLGGGVQDPFLSGRMGMCFSGPWRFGEIQKYAPGLWEKDLGIAPLPAAPGASTMSLGSGSALAIPKGSKNPAAAWKFMKFFTDPEQVLEYCSATGVSPVRRSAATSPKFGQTKHHQIVAEAAKDVIPWIDPPVDYWGPVDNAFQAALLQGKDPEEVFYAAVNTIQKSLEEFYARK